MKKVFHYLAFLICITSSCGYTYRSSFLIPSNNWSRIKCVAVMPFQNLTEHPDAGNIMADILSTELYLTQRFGIVERTEVQRFINEIGLTIPKEIDLSFAKRIGELMGVDGVVLGSVTEFWYRNARQKFSEEEPVVGAGFKLVETETGDVLWSSSYTRTSYDVFLTQRDPLNRIAQIVAEKAIYPIHTAPGPDGKIDLVCADGWKKVAQTKLALSKGTQDKEKQAAASPQGDTPKPQKASQIQSPPPLKDANLIALSNRLVKGKSILAREIKFVGNTSDIEPSSYVFLDGLGKVLRSRPDIRLRIDAHSEPFGTPEERKTLTARQAEAIKNLLVSRYNIPSERISTAGFGSDVPLMPNITQRGREMNRRIELTVLDSR